MHSATLLQWIVEESVTSTAHYTRTHPSRLIVSNLVCLNLLEAGYDYHNKHSWVGDGYTACFKP